jgi:DNA processing protein
MGENQLVKELLNIGVANHKTHQDTNSISRENGEASSQINTSQNTPETTPESRHPPNPEVELDATLKNILQMIPDVPISLDNLVKTTQLDTSVLLGGLLQLELAGVIAQLPGGQYQRT